MKFIVFALTAFFVFTVLIPTQTNAQRRDYLTDEEIELVRDAQQIDLRVAVLVKAVERRLIVLTNDQTQTKRVEKDLDKWGELPKGTRTELLSDIAKILQKAVDDIDDIARREGGMDSEFFPKAVHNLAEYSQKLQPRLASQLDQIKDEKERGSILTALDLTKQIIEASAKVPKEIPKEKKKKKKDDKDN